ncbi:dUTP diphosphatase [bacterium]|nr:dUTP diphosphatase [bacterium]
MAENTPKNNIQVKLKTAPGAKLPVYKTTGAAGADICSNEDIVIKSGGRTVVPTGLFPEIPDGYELQVRSRSGLAAKNGLFVLNSPGTIDSDYRGEIKVILANLGEEDFVISKGDRIAQLILSPVLQALFVETDELSGSSRGEGGFGSTGVKA